jgi:hypothetical protein
MIDAMVYPLSSQYGKALMIDAMVYPLSSDNQYSYEVQ